ncbi:TraR/DksA C4-type zinc finger protein [Tropicimonas sp. TH_r6]|uniref:TraR/DksA family transcriptional regulator n=1 Tax=Tropicimonas sp. TH_r6 TaxID=3082085 RepID=UPI0029545E97|nr:TraR/DksA C4-type zinc finger protein [Tropicimonas sp. TH_r6]MDV7143510.1 TraR/DksA C4-type zinc finger protein [Tropicimonas sp. TH_r6]
MVGTSERKAQLEARLKVLEEKLFEIGAELDSHQSRDWEELAIERETDEVLEGEGRAGKVEMAAIRAALVRIDENTYGDCVQCGDDIAEARLDLLPFTPLCADCARKLSR